MKTFSRLENWRFSAVEKTLGVFEPDNTRGVAR